MDMNERFATACGMASNRFSDALAIQAGACNPSGVARSLVRAINACLAEGMGTDAIRNDAAVRMIVHQLAFLLKVDEINTGMQTYHDLTLACEAHCAAPAGGAPS